MVDLFLVHVAGADRSDQDSFASCSHGEDDKNATVLASSANADKALLFAGMFRVREDCQGPLEEALDVANGKAMLLAFLAVTLVLIELQGANCHQSGL